VGQCYCFPIVVTGSTLPPPEGGTIATLQYNDCFGVLTARAFSTGPGTYYQCIQVIDSVVQYDPVGTEGIDESYLTLTYLTGNCNTGYSCTGYTPAVTPTPTPTSTPVPSQNIQVVECGTLSPSYGITINISGLVVGLVEKMNGGGGVLDNKCWEIIDANYTGTIDYFGTHVSTSLNCSSCLPTPTPTGTPTPTPTSTATPTPTPTSTVEPESCLCYCYTYTTVPNDLYVRYAVCGTASTETELINNLETMDNGDGTFTACICVRQGGAYAIPVCVQGGLEVTCPDTWVSGGSCTIAGTCFLG
jgi:hypothetical protein